VIGLHHLVNMGYSHFSLMKGAEELSLKKQLKQKYGGQLKDFFLEDAGMYQDVEDTELFFTSEERQHILLHLLNNIRLGDTEKVLSHVMLEGQPISESSLYK